MEAALIYPHQLFENHPVVTAGRPVWLIEDPLFFGNDPHWPAAMHKQKLVLHRASMKAYAAELEGVHYVEAVAANPSLEGCIPEQITKIHLCDPADHILMRRVRRFADKRRIALVVHQSPNFLSPPRFLETHIASRKKPFMAKFYEAQRKRLRVLVEDDDTPVGGKWSFDTDNRQKLPKGYRCPPAPLAASNSFVTEAIAYVSRHFPAHPGSLDSFRWPVTRQDARLWLDRFFEERFAEFGIYEDAISTANAFIHHAAITPMLNIGLLDPRDVIERALAKGGTVPMNSLEGFIRQVIGWREFMHGIYRHRGTEIRTRNFWNFQTPLPRSFYDGTTGIPPVDRVIRQLQEDGYCHHIERLMVLGNFMLLCRIRPDDVYRWFMEMFIDSYDWVMVPNVYGMSQFADGGTFTTKPYLSGSNYIRKMSDEPAGAWCDLWDGLFWSFIDDHQAFFLRNPRLSMMVRTWQKMPQGKQEAHRGKAAEFLADL
jgi:deoxyribodipyrimidine photolyase-related protein